MGEKNDEEYEVSQEEYIYEVTSIYGGIIVFSTVEVASGWTVL